MCFQVDKYIDVLCFSKWMARLIYDDIWIFPLQHVPVMLASKGLATSGLSLQKKWWFGAGQENRPGARRGMGNLGFGGNDRNLMMHKKLILVKQSRCWCKYGCMFYSSGRKAKKHNHLRSMLSKWIEANAGYFAWTSRHLVVDRSDWCDLEMPVSEA